MDAVTPTASQSPQKPFWKKFLNLEVAINAFVVWLVLFCYNLYGYFFNWVSNERLLSITFYIKRIIMFVALYFFFLLINFLVKHQAFKSIYNKKIAYIVLITWSIMNLSCYQLLFFDYIQTVEIYLLKILHLFALYALVLTICKLIQRRHNPKIKNQLILTGIFCVTGWLFLLLTYPGTWSIDDIVILNKAASYHLFPWHHIFTAMFYIFCLQTIPFVFSVIFFQVFINALIFSYCVTTLADIFTKTQRQKILLQIILSLIFLFPPVFFHTLGGYRIGIYQFLEIYLLTKLIKLYYNKTSLTWLNIADLTCLTILVGTWRTECFYYPIILFAVLFLLGKEHIKRTTALMMAIVSFSSIFLINNLNIKLHGNNNYTICSTMPIVCKIIREVDDLDANTVAVIDKIFDYDLVKTGPELPLPDYFWSGYMRSYYSQSDYHNYINTTLKLYLKYPEIAFNYLNDNLKKTLFGNELTMQLEYSIVSFSNPNYHNYWYNFETITDNFLHKPINTKFRNDVINWLNGFSVNYDFVYPYYKITPFYSLSYNLAIPLCLFLISIIIVLIRRRWFLLIPCIAIICHIAIVFFTAPEYYFFYYLSVYLFMYAFSFIILFNGITDLINKLKEKHQRKLKTQ